MLPAALILARSSGDVLLDRRFAYAEALRREGDHEAAADLLRQILDQAPAWLPAWMSLGLAAEQGGDRVEAARAYGEAAARDDDGLFGARLHVARLQGRRAEQVMPRAYVATLFDGYAARFDRHLVDSLAYDGPAVILAALRAANAPPRFGRGLDLGCGTGLMGRAVDGMVDRLDGVDLSPLMVAEAARTGLYATLAVADVAEALAAWPAATLDLVLAADVLVYCGALDPVLRGVAQALAPGAWLAFTIQQGEEPIRLGDDMRFSHSAGYIETTLAASGLDRVHCATASTRQEAGQPVPGLVVVARRP